LFPDSVLLPPAATIFVVVKSEVHGSGTHIAASWFQLPEKQVAAMEAVKPAVQANV
jgi:hypothetical protein